MTPEKFFYSAEMMSRTIPMRPVVKINFEKLPLKKKVWPLLLKSLDETKPGNNTVKKTMENFNIITIL